jgi:glycogen operon protein
VKRLCSRRLLLDAALGYPSLIELLRRAKVSWHGVKLGQPDWGFTSHSLALYFEAHTEDLLLYFIFNAYWEPLEFELPLANQHNPWRRWIDTSLDSPGDIAEWETAPPVETSAWRAAPHSVTVLYARA